MNPSAASFQPAIPPPYPLVTPSHPPAGPYTHNSSPPNIILPNPYTQIPAPTSNDVVPNLTAPASATESATESKSFQDFNDKWSSTFSSNSNWEEFSNQCYQFANDVILECDKNFQNRKRAAPRQPGRPSARPINNRRPLQYNPIEARRIQSLYRLSKKRATRQVLNDSKPSYSGSVDEAN